MAEVISYTKERIDQLLAALTLTSSRVTDFVEAVQDVVGQLISAAGGTYDDTNNLITLPSTPSATAAVQGKIRLANHLGGNADNPTVRVATTSVDGIVELATTAEATAGTDTSRAVTAAGVKAAIGSRPTSDTVVDIWTGTQAQYDAITTKDPATLYFIKG